MSYNISPSYYPTYTYPQPQAGVMSYGPVAQSPVQQIQGIPNSVTPPQPALTSNIQWVQGEAAALAYTVAPGNTVILMDSDNPVVYKKSTDERGKPLPMDIYDLIKREPVVSSSPTIPSVDLKEYVKKSEIDTYISNRLEKELDKRVSQLSFKPATRKKRLDEDDDED